ncbi:50S ribosomal subunit L30 [Aulographum hederae CBS 113979]|uniref:Large ribosomal subunit protein mL46 n=1 Tax=Aulographum hederae CBS 113979 TaxID=1176131 RepID=A0A6G1HCY8_9PEZI|nr:50S ribosomal subunit L30 [Aulographum hederae CBS 113979]
MSSGSSGARRLASIATRPDTVCRSCWQSIARRPYSAAAAAVAEAPETPETSSNSNQKAAKDAPKPRIAYQIHAGVCLSRPPQITRDLTPFEESFFLYQKRLNERLSLPFTRYFYIAKGTVAEADWKRKIKARLTPARDIGVFNPFKKQGWNDEVLVGDTLREQESQVDALLKDAIPSAAPGQEGMVVAKEDVLVEKPMPRVTESDITGDRRSLNRLLQRTLYLVVKNSQGKWLFPHDQVVGKEWLHNAAERILVQSGGPNMNTWVVGNHPIGWFRYNFTSILNPDRGTEEIGRKVFFMKARIMAGQADLQNNIFGYQDFAWLSREELEEAVTKKYWDAIKNMLADR